MQRLVQFAEIAIRDPADILTLKIENIPVKLLKIGLHLLVDQNSIKAWTGNV